MRPARLVVVLVALAGCSRPVSVPPVEPAPPAPVAQACRQLQAQLPDALATVGTRRASTPDSPLTAAYGDPPVAIRCGVPGPAALTPTSLLVTVDGVDWLPEELTGGWLLTTVGRVANVEVTVPTAQGPAPSVAADLSGVIIRAIPASVPDP